VVELVHERHDEAEPEQEAQLVLQGAHVVELDWYVPAGQAP